MRAPRGIGEEMKIQDQQLEITMASVEPCDGRFIAIVSMAPFEDSETAETGFITHIRIPFNENETVVVSEVYIVPQLMISYYRQIVGIKRG